MDNEVNPAKEAGAMAAPGGLRKMLNANSKKTPRKQRKRKRMVRNPPPPGGGGSRY